jgi:hypothetical protein
VSRETIPGLEAQVQSDKPRILLWDEVEVWVTCNEKQKIEKESAIEDSYLGNSTYDEIQLDSILFELYNNDFS